MPFFGPFVDKVGPVLSAAFCNAIDEVQNALNADANGGVVLNAPTIAETSLLVNTFAGQLSLGLQGGGLQISAGVIGTGISITQDPTGFGLINNLSNQGLELTGGNFTVVGPAANLPTIGVTGDIVANAFALRVNAGGSGQIMFRGREVANVAQPGYWLFDAPTNNTTTVTVNSPNNNYGLQVTAPLTTNQSYGMIIQAGTSAGIDAALNIVNANRNLTIFTALGNGGLSGTGPYSLSQGTGATDMTPDFGTFTGTVTGMTTALTGPFKFAKMGNLVLVYAAASISGTSNSNSMSVIGIPTAILPTNAPLQITTVSDLNDNGFAIMGTVTISGSGNGFIFGATNCVNGAPLRLGNFTASGQKGFGSGASWVYSLV
jgi:hypothetical protein